MPRRVEMLSMAVVLIAMNLVRGEDNFGDTILHETFSDGPAGMAKSFANQGLAWFNEPTVLCVALFSSHSIALIVCPVSVW